MGLANVIASTSSIRGPATCGGPVVLFIHGGYWQALDKSFSSHLARGANERGLTVAVPNYTLAPAATLAEIVSEMEAAADFLMRRTGRPLVATGHSAGGHLAACLMARPEPQSHARAGRHADLRPVRPAAPRPDLPQQGSRPDARGGPAPEPAGMDAAGNRGTSSPLSEAPRAGNSCASPRPSSNAGARRGSRPGTMRSRGRTISMSLQVWPILRIRWSISSSSSRRRPDRPTGTQVPV